MMVFSAENGWLWIPTGSYAPLKSVGNAKYFGIVIAEEMWSPKHPYEETVNAMGFSADKTVICCCLQ